MPRGRGGENDDRARKTDAEVYNLLDEGRGYGGYTKAQVMRRTHLNRRTITKSILRLGPGVASHKGGYGIGGMMYPWPEIEFVEGKPRHKESSPWSRAKALVNDPPLRGSTARMVGRIMRGNDLPRWTKRTYYTTGLPFELTVRVHGGTAEELAKLQKRFPSWMCLVPATA